MAYCPFVRRLIMVYPAASNGVSSANYYRSKGRGIKPLSAEGGLKEISFLFQHSWMTHRSLISEERLKLLTDNPPPAE